MSYGGSDKGWLLFGCLAVVGALASIVGIIAGVVWIINHVSFA